MTIQVCVQNTLKMPESCKLFCILVVGLDHGRDYFVVISANYNHLRPLGRSESAVELQSREKIVSSSSSRNIENNVETSLTKKVAKSKDNRDDWLIDL